MCNIIAGDLARAQPGVDGGPLIWGKTAAGDPDRRRSDLDVRLLACGELHLRRLVEVLTVGLDGNVIPSRRNIAIKGAAQFGRADISAIGSHSGQPLAGIGLVIPVEPNSSLRYRDRWNCSRGGHSRLGAAHYRKQECASSCLYQPS